MKSRGVHGWIFSRRPRSTRRACLWPLHCKEAGRWALAGARWGGLAGGKHLPHLRASRCLRSCLQTGSWLRSTHSQGTWASLTSRRLRSSPSNRLACHRVGAGSRWAVMGCTSGLTSGPSEIYGFKPRNFLHGETDRERGCVPSYGVTFSGKPPGVESGLRSDWVLMAGL